MGCRFFLINVVLVLGLISITSTMSGAGETVLPIEPDESTRIDEIYDHETNMLLFLYSLKGDGIADYVTGRKVWEHQRSVYGNPVYYFESYPLFYWWNHQLWNDPLQDGVNGNERLYADHIEFDASRYKPCLFNGQPC
ncbi:MAG: hypothetical protein D6690_12180 [Nitrospirae bacterium]|nr:MAG: hypothetical protein D6690_12180 [Nitrospirota bacterium]